ncbi:MULTISPECIES: dihydroorotate dehydrogenase electron transfer subunit [Paraclostridium]|uniref:Dihydroorotate dehydrogenase electron transfer subunit n=1 Tax=Paraclostridium bifermentans TaxID=1490 RepID=A0AA44DMP9_PARBF|nr:MULTISPECIES: dihydroorotate dehydrogenase electron transfer subunit [Paraclostridium]MBN8049059.1 dihydroorotate dehydrogenase electron transfer subunit [Paraclostridium bifermentans]MBZ6006421.1 dihydroorotate dehydrogenase electron transfer subunit [Paraclostridium bifermentans]MDU0298179.1 dihydroorotate dehydrogenase electron transfer subunit [Paraclostridium sp. MRS3W1]NME10562.1 dihydroorotate dehydrogenase electron transfer subunit [Paraclostridium bifermentans]
MYKILENKYIGEDMYFMKVEGEFEAKMGQFYMLRAWDTYPLLSRPISVHDVNEDSISFLYKVVGEGTKILSNLRVNDEIKLEGPYGNGYENVKGKVALVGGGIGIAPLYLVAKNIENCDAYLGFRKEAILEEEYNEVCNEVNIAIGDTFVTDILDVEKYDYILTCGPTPMMKKLVNMTEGTNTKIMVSLENHMACGVGACLVCTCKTKFGNKKTCKDGPVFWGEDVIFNG